MIIKYKKLGELQGYSTVLVCGAFDLMHYGHIDYLSRIKSKFPTHKLVVALIPDQRVRYLKGPKRPILGQLERAKVIDSLSIVDFVVVSPSTQHGIVSSDAKVVAALKPQVVAYSKKKFLSKIDEYKEFGTKVEIFNRSNSKYSSTSKIINKIIDKTK